jgi:hypothetical protein
MLARSKATHPRLPIPAVDANMLSLKDIPQEGLSTAHRYAIPKEFPPSLRGRQSVDGHLAVTVALWATTVQSLTTALPLVLDL